MRIISKKRSIFIATLVFIVIGISIIALGECVISIGQGSVKPVKNLKEVGVSFVEKSFRVKLPDNTIVEKASELDQTCGHFDYVKISLLEEHINEFLSNFDNIVKTPFSIAGSEMSSSIRYMIPWWEINNTNGDYYFDKSYNDDNIYDDIDNSMVITCFVCKPEKGRVAVFMEN